MKYLDLIFALPGWLILKFMLFFMKDHSWKTQKISLHEWTRARTSLIRQFDLMWWLFIMWSIAFSWRVFV